MRAMIQPDEKFKRIYVFLFIQKIYTYLVVLKYLQSFPIKLKGKGQDIATERQKEYYTYDPVGNRLTSEHNWTYTYNTGNQLITKNGTTYTYDSNGNLITKTSDSETTIYTYDYENRLIYVVKAESGQETFVEFKYDPFGRRIEKRVTEDGITTTTRYFYDNEDILFEYDEYGNISNRYIHGLGIDEPLALENNDGIYYYHADGLGSIVALTDSSGKVVQDYEYDSFGNLKDQKNRIKQPYTFTGREWDKQTALYYYRARYYHPEIGRFISFDPILHPANGQSTYYRKGVEVGSHLQNLFLL
jgi:RHS repeat-associated protein